MLPANIVITGASSGLGAALARHYAAPDVVLGLIGRNEERLNEVADACRKRGARVETALLSVTDSLAMTSWLEAFDAKYPVTLCIANAGISAGTGGGGETLQQATRIFDVNLHGVLNTVHPVMDRMILRRKGQIAIVSSLAGFRGLPTAPAYSASKAAVRYYGQALQSLLIRHNVKVSIICPGFIRTPMTDVNPFPMPFMMRAEDAAHHIADKLGKGKSRIVFPWPMAIMARLQNLVPDWIMNRIYARMPGKPQN